MHNIRINFGVHGTLAVTTPKIGYLIHKTTKFIANSSSFMNWTCFNPFNVTYLGDDRPALCQYNKYLLRETHSHRLRNASIQIKSQP